MALRTVLDLSVCAIAAYLLEPRQHDGVGTGLAGEVGLKRTGNTLTEARMSDQPSELSRQMHPQLITGVADFGDELLAAIDKRGSARSQPGVDRPGFALNPTNCDSMSVSGEAIGSSGATSALSSHFQLGGCSSLKFAPKFSVSTTGQASKANGASLTAKLSYPYAGQGAVNLSKPSRVS